jgi:hypothetical protein
MRKFVLLAVAALALFAFSGAGAFAQSSTVTLTMGEQNGSGQNGASALVDAGSGSTAVAINISGGSDTPQPAHIHRGTCANLDPKPAFPLTSVVNGTSETIVNVSMAELTSGNYAINVHKSAAEASVYVSCGDIVAQAVTTGGGGAPTTVGMPRTGAPNLLLQALALALLAASITGAGIHLARRKA